MLLEMSLNNFTRLLSSDAPAPGGGSVSALNGLLGAALITMVCRLSIGRTGLEQYEDELIAALEKANNILIKLSELVDRDTDAFNQVMTAFNMPKTTGTEKSIRNIAIQDAYRIATEIPLKVASCSCSLLQLIASISNKFNLNTVSDLGVGAKCSYLGLTGALLNVKINLPAVKDKQYVSIAEDRSIDLQNQADLFKAKIDKIIKPITFTDN